MSEPTEVILSVPCTRCGQVVNVPHTPNPFIGEEFVRLLLVCDTCMAKTKRQILGKIVEQASLPYRDDD